MTEHFFAELRDDWQRAAHHFGHGSNTIIAEHTQPASPQETKVALAEQQPEQQAA